MVHELKTRGDHLVFAISFALMRAVKIVRGLRKGLTEEKRSRKLFMDRADFPRVPTN